MVTIWTQSDALIQPDSNPPPQADIYDCKAPQPIWPVQSF